VEDADTVTWEVGVPSVSISIDEVSFWHLVAGGLAVEGWAPSKSCQRFLSLLEELDFWPGAMVKVKGQPMEGREGSVNWKTVGKGRKGAGVEVLGGRRT